MSDRFTVFVQELSMIRQHSIKLDPVLIFISGLARTDFQLSRAEILNFLMAYSEELSKITDEEYRNNILFKISLGLLEDAKQLLEFRRNGGNDVRHLLYKVRASGNIGAPAGNETTGYGVTAQYSYQNFVPKPPSNHRGETLSRTDGFLIPAPVDQTMNTYLYQTTHPTINPTASSSNDHVKNPSTAHLIKIPNIQAASTMSKHSVKPLPQITQTDTSILQASSRPQPTSQFRSEVLTKHICFFCKKRFGNEPCSNNQECGHLYHSSCLTSAFDNNPSYPIACPVQDCKCFIPPPHVNSGYFPNIPSPIPCPSCGAVISVSTYSCSINCPCCNTPIT
jgi:hypothetical protein